ncbi:hypothetical protein KL86PLE_60143 [uncultured Pleomorphomonas sp.]|uniref:Uncharacterized protein n=1 Tax=uncultured Pleomorphomonas sp. TaxID=442121 RepID=A0A212LK13_9HYPH|nr:hypothetical protein KL86PLE_60143 [uncultured Pleomorphomonas sp.]
MIVLGEIIGPGRLDGRGDRRRPAGPGKRLAVGFAGGFRHGALRFAVHEDRRTVLGADVVALAHALRRIVAFEEQADEIGVGDGVRVEHHLHRLGMAGAARADLLVGRVLGEAADIADRRQVDAGQAPEQPLGTPEAAEGEGGDGVSLRHRALQRSAGDEMGFGGGNRPGAARQRRLGRRQDRWLPERLEKGHGSSLSPRRGSPRNRLPKMGPPPLLCKPGSLALGGSFAYNDRQEEIFTHGVP